MIIFLSTIIFVNSLYFPYRVCYFSENKKNFSIEEYEINLRKNSI